MVSNPKNDFGDIFSKRLSALMKSTHKTQAEIAVACGVGQSAVHKWLRGTIPGGLELYRLTRLFGVTAEFLLFEDAPSQYPQSDSAFAMRDEVSQNIALVKRLKTLEQKIDGDLKDLREIIKELEKQTS